MFCEVNLLGRVSKEPELIGAVKSTNAVKFSVAYNSTQKKADGSFETCFVNCVAFGYNADKALAKLQKGSMVSVRGNLQVTAKQDEKGSWVYYTSISVDKMVCFGNNANANANAQKANANTAKNAYKPVKQVVNGNGVRDYDEKYDINNFDNDTDEVPF